MEDETHPNIPLTILNKIGKGCQGEVFEVIDHTQNQHRALKVIYTDKLDPKEKLRVEFQTTSNMHLSKEVQSIHFPYLHNHWITNTSVNLLFELCQQNADSALKHLQTYQQRYNFVMVLVCDILKALSLLQYHSIIHRDVKPENILLKEGIFKLADLGLSRCLTNGNLTNDVGNRMGRSPQFYTGRYSCNTDVWSLAIHAFFMLEGTLPFDQNALMAIKQNPNDLDRIICTKSFEITLQPMGRRSRNILSPLHLILLDMLIIDPILRPPASQLLSIHFNTDRSLSLRNIFVNQLVSTGVNKHYFLVILMIMIENNKLETKLQKDKQDAKRKLCLKIKSDLFKLISLLNPPQEPALFFFELLKIWHEELIKEGFHLTTSNSAQQLYEQILDVYKYPKLAEKLPLLQQIVKATICLQNNKKLPNLWHLPIDIPKIL